MSQTTEKSRTRIVVKDLEFLITYSHNDNEISEFNEEKAKLTQLVKESGISKKIALTTLKSPLPRTTCDIFVGAIGTTKAEKTTVFSGIAIKHKNDHNNRCIARSTAFDHVVDSKEFSEFLTNHSVSKREFRKAALETLGLRYIKSPETDTV